MDQERFDHVARGLALGTSRRGLLGAGAALLALLGAKPVVAGKAAKPKGQPKGQPGNSQPGSGQNGQLGSGQNGSPGPSPVCLAQCQERYEGCLEPCAMNPDAEEFCVNRCATQQITCETGCPTG